jgi:hypothetical protein
MALQYFLLGAAGAYGLYKMIIREDGGMFDCASEMSGFHSEKVNLSGSDRTKMRERRNANRTRLKRGLQKNNNPSLIGQRTQGSYAMWTMVQDENNDYDIDDGAYFKKDDLVNSHGNYMTAHAVRCIVRDALDDGSFNRTPEVKENCVRVYYNDGSHIDVPSYRTVETTNIWGEKVTEVELAGPNWKDSDPKGVTDWFKAANKAQSDDADNDQFRRMIRLLKNFSKSRPSWKTTKGASGFTITKLVEEKFVAAPSQDDRSLRDTMQAIADRLEWDLSVAHPTVQGEWLAGDDDARTRRFRDRLKENLSHLEVLDDAECTRAQALRAWSRVFNDDYFKDQICDGDDDPNGSGSKSALSSAFIISEADGANVDSAVDKQGGGKYA